MTNALLQDWFTGSHKLGVGGFYLSRRPGCIADGLTTSKMGRERAR